MLSINKILLIFFFLLYVLTVAAQDNGYCNNRVIPAIEDPRQAESGERDYADTLKACIRLIFEKQFNDSVIIMLDSSIIYNSMLVTNRPGAPWVKIVDIDYSNIQHTPRIIIKKVNGECMWFFLRQGYRIAYINYVSQLKAWVVELSNIQRQYI